jgi:hypothetical protein
VNFRPLFTRERALSGGRKAWEKATGSITGYIPALVQPLAMLVAAPLALTPFFEPLVWGVVNRANAQGQQDGHEQVGSRCSQCTGR